MAISKSSWVLIAGAGALAVGLVLMPRTPGSSEPALPVEHGVALEDIGTDPVDVAVAKVSGENPMEASSNSVNWPNPPRPIWTL